MAKRGGTPQGFTGFPHCRLTPEAQHRLIGVFRTVVGHLSEGIEPSVPEASDKWGQPTSSECK